MTRGTCCLWSWETPPVTVGIVRKCENCQYGQKHHIPSPDTEVFSGVRRSVTPCEALKPGVAGGHYRLGFSGSSKKIWHLAPMYPLF